MPQYLLKFIKTPLFFAQSFVDAYQVTNVMGLACTPGSSENGACNKKSLKYIKKFRKHMLKSMEESRSMLTGYWFVSCPIHTIANHDFAWKYLVSDQKTLRETFLGWYGSFVNASRGEGKFHLDVNNYTNIIIAKHDIFLLKSIYYSVAA